MIRGKIFDILGRFSSAELRRFGDFAASPYFNRNKKIAALADIFISHAPDFESLELEKKALFDTLYPGKEYKDSAIRTLISDLTRLAERFIVEQALEDNPMLMEKMLAASFREKHLYALFEKKLSEVRSLLDNGAVSREDYGVIAGILQEVCELNYLKHLENVEKVKDGFFEAIMYSKLEYYKTFLGIYKEMLSHNLSYKYEPDAKLADEFARLGNEVESDPEIKEKHPSIYAEYLCCMILLRYKGESSYYKKLFDYINKFKKKFTAEELHSKYLVALNYCTHHLDRHTKKFLDESLKVIRAMEEDTLKELRYMEPNSFEAIASCMIYARHTDWLVKFLKRNIKKLPDELQDNTRNYLLGRMYFTIGEYDKALEYLAKVKYLRIHHYTHSKVLMAQIYYSFGEYDNCLTSLDLLKRYVKRKEIMVTDTYNMMNDFAVYAARLAILAGNKNEKGLMRLEKDLSDMKESVLKSWILDKVKMLK